MLEAEAQQLHEEAMERKLRASEAEQAAKEGKAVARHFGLGAMGSRCNMLMTIQVPLEQSTPPPTIASPSFAGLHFERMWLSRR